MVRTMIPQTRIANSSEYNDNLLAEESNGTETEQSTTVSGSNNT